MKGALGHIAAVLLCLLPIAANAQTRFFNLTAGEVKIDSLLPNFTYAIPLEEGYEDSTYVVEITYPEFIDASASDVAAYHRVSGDILPSLPEVRQGISLNRRKASLVVDFCPLVYRDNRWQWLVSFMLRVTAVPRAATLPLAATLPEVASMDRDNRYAEHSVLSQGNWAKIRVPATGVYQLTESLIRKAGFTDLSKVRVYGYGGNLQDEVLSEQYLKETDDLREVPLYVDGDRRLFYAKGSVSWESPTAVRRTRNPYSDYGYYFITQGDAEPLTQDSVTFVSAFYPSPDDYHVLYEHDAYSWYNGGRNLFDGTSVSLGNTQEVVLTHHEGATRGTLSVNISAGNACSVQVSVNDSIVGTLRTSLSSYDEGGESAGTYVLNTLRDKDVVSLLVTQGGPMRLDYVSMSYDTPMPVPNLSEVSAVPEYVCNITNQDHHADTAVDMVVIIPASGKLMTQAQRLKTFHENHDGLSVRIVPADELYNEFSSGTPDATAYRRYMKMLYDRATTEEEMPKYLLLFGDGVWDNRMLTASCEKLNPDDYLLCYESENSFNRVYCYVSDDFYALLDDEERLTTGNGSSALALGLADIAIGRFPVSTASDAQIMVDKVIAYASSAGDWQNTIMVMADDGNDNIHMHDANLVCDDIEELYPGYVVKKVMWDAYRRESSATGNAYPDASKAIRRQQEAGALIMDYVGHGDNSHLSHEMVVNISDFSSFTNENLPLWITASCDIMPFDGMSPNIGEAAVLNEKGGAVSFFGTTRTVYIQYNKAINRAFMRYALSRDGNGKPITVGEAQRLAKNEVITTGADRTTNKLQYTLLGDPALALRLPVAKIVVDSINGSPVSSVEPVWLSAGSTATVKGHIEGHPDFNGMVTATVRDAEELVVCKLNNAEEADTAFKYRDRVKVLFSGSDYVKNGEFSFSFAVAKDINYANERGMLNLYAVSDDKSVTANGYCDDFMLGGSDINGTDSIGPSIYCYLNSSSFVDGGNVNTTPYFVAEITDKDGINTTGNGIGHDLQLVIDGDPSKTYNLNDNFTYDFGSYTKGSTYFSIPELEPGPHKLKFRAWDILNNSSTTELSFNVVRSLQPQLFGVDVTDNPATTGTTFIISHDRMSSQMDVTVELYDFSGRKLWTHSEKGVSTDGAYTVDWDLTVDGGRKLGTGVYIYRVLVSSDGSKPASQARKLIILGNN